MAEPRWEDVEALFDLTMDQPAGTRREWLEAHGADPGLKAVVGRMISAEGRGGPLDQPIDLSPFSLVTQLEAALGERYTLVEEIGRGGMATVFLARERKHDRPVVLKVLNPETARALGVDRFLAEIHAAAQLAHPHILPLIDSGEAGGLLYFVMPFLGGETLRSALRRERTLAAAVTYRVLHDLATALVTAHTNGIVHRDIKPENVLLVGDHAYLLDFGLVQFRSRDTSTRITGAGAVLGTIGYMAPEQEAGSATDHRADLYAWGVLAREMLTGSEPGWMSHAIPPTLPAGTPPPLLTVLRRCLQPAPADRPQDARELVQAMERVLGMSGDTPLPVPPGNRWLAAAGLVALVGAGGYLLAQRTRQAADVDLTAPVAVAPLTNETGDSTLGTWGRMAGDWITQGLQETGAATVIPWPYALQAEERWQAERKNGNRPDLVQVMKDETGAAIIITGAYYLAGDRVRFQAQITDAASGRLLAHADPAEASRDSVAVAIQHLRDRIMGAVAVWHDEDAVETPGLMIHPPTFAAYREFDRGVALHLGQEYDSAAAAYRNAFALDSSFGTALVYAATDLWNTEAYAAVDSVLGQLSNRRIVLSPYQQVMVEYLRARLAGQGDKSRILARRAYALTRESRGGYTVAWSAVSTNHPREAVAALDRINPDRGAMRLWAPYWSLLAHARHMVGDFAGEEVAAVEYEKRFPENRIPLVLMVRSAAARGDTRKVDSMLLAAEARSTDTYWSQGAAMTVAGEELAAHGRAFAANAYFNRAVNWLANQLLRAPSHRGHRYWIGSALYNSGRWPEAEPYFESLMKEFPDRQEYRQLYALTIAHAGRFEQALVVLGPRPHYNPGTHTFFRARIAAIAGQRQEALSLLAQAASEGYTGMPWVHSTGHRDLSILSTEAGFRELFTY
jgi:tetratricopeptide (TPR) repeat protein